MDNEKRVKLRILGLSYNPLKSGAFALLLAQEDGPYRIPIVIGSAEAQSIAIVLEQIVTPRPLTHDLFCSFAHAFKVELVDVFIYEFKDGIFSSSMRWTDGINEVSLDARTSDAIAIALRTGAPIYTTEEIVHTAGTIFKDDALPEAEASVKDRNHKLGTRLEDLPMDELQQLLAKKIEEESYEEAAKISQIIKRRNGEGD